MEIEIFELVGGYIAVGHLRDQVVPDFVWEVGGQGADQSGIQLVYFFIPSK